MCVHVWLCVSVYDHVYVYTYTYYVIMYVWHTATQLHNMIATIAAWFESLMISSKVH